MNLVGQHVTHRKYGAGTITRIEENKMEVDFQTDLRIFLYPDSFETYVQIGDAKARDYIQQKLKEQQAQRQAAKEQSDRRLMAAIHAGKKRKNGHAVFSMDTEELEAAYLQGSVFAGNYLSGKLKGKPRIPENINANSLCILTMKSKEEPESERQIVGVCMPSEDFIGTVCKDGVIQMHPEYRVVWNEEYEKLMFWSYIPEASRLERWGNIPVKYVTDQMAKRVLSDMCELAAGTEYEEKLGCFYEYFCEMNHL